MDPFEEIVGREHVRTDASALRLFSADLFFWPQGRTCRAVIAPGSPEEVARAVRAAAALGCAVVCRGAGLSYAGGCVPHQENAVVLDLRRLNRVRAIERTDRYAIVEAGCTWGELDAALRGTGLRTVLRGALCGAGGTIGGALSQGLAQDMGGVLSLEVVTGSGKLIHTGSAARSAHPAPFFRHHGPDLTGLFLGDCGRLGVKTAAALALEPPPRAHACASFDFDTFEALMRAAVACARLPVPLGIFGLDPAAARSAALVGLRGAIEALVQAGGRRSRLGSATKRALAQAAAGRDVMAGVQWSLHLTSAGSSERAAREAIEPCREECLREGREMHELLPLALAARPGPVRSLLGPAGERWVAIHGIVPPSLAERAATSVRQTFGPYRQRMRSCGMWESYQVTVRSGAVLIEPALYWPDELGPLHLEQLADDAAEQRAPPLPNAAARALALELRERLTAQLQELGAAHVQLGKAYPYRSQLASQTAETLERIRAALDPDECLNPGNLER